MKKILWIIPLIIVGCSSQTKKEVPLKDTSEDSNLYEGDVIFRDCKDKGITYQEYMQQIDKSLDSMTKNGEYILVRGSNRNYDTIIDHIRYKYVTKK